LLARETMTPQHEFRKTQLGLLWGLTKHTPPNNVCTRHLTFEINESDDVQAFSRVLDQK